MILAESQPGIVMKHEEMTFEERCVAVKRVVRFYVVHA